ncbi:hypothetical protein FisN_19Hh156 [Fistulifera solaris]|uniref:Expansin-like EG45 domain-containing protein n=1 Tax=Fistulifera solaris TaxID=1519565 RepID=A0A1Z5K0M9_FISSO|nr:hypothetical protein FisN_19Hh156 [Fistulifera solaris]|eukprot:GAX19578.1 hypothetical protein FisN_19Hh156 [Fistulifera solaris]
MTRTNRLLNAALAFLLFGLPQCHAERWLQGACGLTSTRDDDTSNSDNDTGNSVPGQDEISIPAGTTKGLLTRWQTPGYAIPPGSCQLTQDPSIAKGSSWLEPYAFNGTRVCAVPIAMFQDGLDCGSCYELTYTGEKATNVGRAGKATIQVINHGDIMGFDCQPEVFEEITGNAVGGIFPVYFKRVDCIYTPPTVVVLTGDNAYYTKVLVAGGHEGVRAVSMTLGGKRYNLSRVNGATWGTKLDGQSGATSFSLTYRDGTVEEVSGCFGGKWPVATSSQCS